MEERDKKFAILIDAENISPKYINFFMDEITKYGVITYKRAYADWTNAHLSRWKLHLMENSITPIQQFSNTIKKNASDSTLIIDAMDILYTGNVDGFCIVSSDSDFTRLASRLRESGMDVIGMGESKTPRSFKAACTVFTSLDLISQTEDKADNTDIADSNDSDNFKYMSKDESSESAVQEIPISTIEKDIIAIIQENNNKGTETFLSELGSRLIKKYPDFDVRNYGYSSLLKFMEDKISSVVLGKSKTNHSTVRLKEAPVEDVAGYIHSLLKEAGFRGVDLGLLGQKIHAKYETFNVVDYGYSKFEQFVQGLNKEYVIIAKDNNGGKTVKYVQI